MKLTITDVAMRLFGRCSILCPIELFLTSIIGLLISKTTFIYFGVILWDKTPERTNLAILLIFGNASFHYCFRFIPLSGEWTRIFRMQFWNLCDKSIKINQTKYPSFGFMIIIWCWLQTLYDRYIRNVRFTGLIPYQNGFLIHQWMYWVYGLG